MTSILILTVKKLFREIHVFLYLNADKAVTPDRTFTNLRVSKCIVRRISNSSETWVDGKQGSKICEMVGRARSWGVAFCLYLKD